MMGVSVVYNEGSGGGGVSGHFGALEQFWLKIVHEELI